MFNLKINKGRWLFYLAGLAIVLTSLLTVSVSGTIAKYARQSEDTKTIVAKEFYFESDFLKEPEENAVVVLNSTATEIEFELRNHADSLRFAKDAINYTVTVTVIDGEGNPVLNPTEGTIENNKANTVTIKLSNLEKGKKYKVTATGEAGYSETIEAVFEVSKTDENIYKYLDTTNPNYVLLTVWTENIEGSVNVEFPEGLIPDATDSAMYGMKNYKEGKYTADTVNDISDFEDIYSSHTYRFFIDKKSAYSADYLDIKKYSVMLKDSAEKTYVAAEAVPQ